MSDDVHCGCVPAYDYNLVCDQRTKALAELADWHAAFPLSPRDPADLPKMVKARFAKAVQQAARLQEKLDGLRAILQSIIYASDGCKGHRNCNHSMEPWEQARAILRDDAKPTSNAQSNPIPQCDSEHYARLQEKLDGLTAKPKWQCSSCGYITTDPVGECKGYCQDPSGESCDAKPCPKCGKLHYWTGSIAKETCPHGKDRRP